MAHYLVKNQLTWISSWVFSIFR